MYSNQFEDVITKTTCLLKNAFQDCPPKTFQNIDKYKKISALGEGTYGIVFEAFDKFTGKVYAIKKIKAKENLQNFPLSSLNEVKTLKSVSHENIIYLKEICIKQNIVNGVFEFNYFLIFEYCEYDLLKLLKDRNVRLTFANIKSIMEQSLRGLNHLHEKGFMHRDIKLENILINKHGVIKLADFGMADLMKRFQNQPLLKLMGTLIYASPEILFGETNYTNSVDIWSLGCVFYEIFARNHLFNGQNIDNQLQLIFNLCGNPDPSDWPERYACYHSSKYKYLQMTSWLREILEEKVPDKDCVYLIEVMIVLNSDQRATAQQLLADPFFSSYPKPKKLFLS
uniref:Cdk2-like protein n=1 Tax=Schmidtea mediterranea TaxID=79327 RepID=D2DJT1_SCHMD|nr:cdk2-like protein [Schmidtea mediterranea]